MTRTSSRSNLLSRGSIGPVRMSSLAISIAKPNDSPYYVGLDKASEDPYDRISNPDGVIQLGLSENRLCFHLIEKWMSENLRDWIMGREDIDLSISGIATYQPVDGTMELKLIMGMHFLFPHLIILGSMYENEEFVSMAEVLDSEDFDKNRVHIVYRLSKDLYLPGFRVGMIYSFNENVLSAARKLTRFSSISAPTQRLLVSMLSDTRFIKEYLETNKRRIRNMHNLFVAAMEVLGIRCADSSAGLYCWANMSKLIPSYSEKGEL
ncbi:hypothetical protein REPUB_Repub07fG0119400 [Reevesia pubescens]